MAIARIQSSISALHQAAHFGASDLDWGNLPSLMRCTYAAMLLRSSACTRRPIWLCLDLFPTTFNNYETHQGQSQDKRSTGDLLLSAVFKR